MDRGYEWYLSCGTCREQWIEAHEDGCDPILHEGRELRCEFCEGYEINSMRGRRVYAPRGWGEGCGWSGDAS